MTPTINITIPNRKIARTLYAAYKAAPQTYPQIILWYLFSVSHDFLISATPAHIKKVAGKSDKGYAANFPQKKRNTAPVIIARTSPRGEFMLLPNMKGNTYEINNAIISDDRIFHPTSPGNSNLMPESKTGRKYPRNVSGKFSK